MIASLKGVLTYLNPNFCIIECAGVGYRCFITGKTLGSMPSIGEEVKLYTFMSVREDAIDLYGFSDIKELDCFKLITTVSGVGSKLGISILTAFSPEQISSYIASNDPKSLTAASGVGLKLAQRIILELKDKVVSFSDVMDDNTAAVVNFAKENINEATAALVSLGYSASEVRNALNKLSADLPIDTLIKEALKILSRQV